LFQSLLNGVVSCRLEQFLSVEAQVCRDGHEYIGTRAIAALPEARMKHSPGPIHRAIQVIVGHLKGKPANSAERATSRHT
jgi:hypothetical protein